MSACLIAGRAALCAFVRRCVKDARSEHMHERKIFALAGLIALSFDCTSAVAQEIKLTLADQNSPIGWCPSHALQPWVKHVDESTRVEANIQINPCFTLIKCVD